MTSLCAVSACRNPVHRRGWCNRHYHRWHRYGDPLAGGAPRGGLQSYFRDVVLTYDGDECLIWPYRRAPDGRAQIRRDGRAQLVHRLACEAENGPPPSPAHEAAHRCGNGHLGCVAKRHTRWLTHAENQAEMVGHGTSTRGERNPLAKLTEDDVSQIRTLGPYLFQREIADIFGVTQGHVSHLLRGDHWGWMQ